MEHQTNRDALLLRQYLETADHKYFEQLVKRHASMVHQACRRILLDDHLAEDAAQDAFVLLAKKARIIRQPELLANWLYGVAVRKSLELRRARRRTPQPLFDSDVAIEHNGEDLTEVATAIDEELAQLPDKYRVPLVMHYFSGTTIRSIARTTGVPSGTLSSRIQRGRALLRSRLVKRGVKAGALALLLALLFESKPVAASEVSISRLTHEVLRKKRPYRRFIKPVPMLASLLVLLITVTAFGVTELLPPSHLDDEAVELVSAETEDDEADAAACYMSMDRKVYEQWLAAQE